MKFSIEREILLSSLQKLNNILRGNPNSQILYNILIKVYDNNLLLIGTNLEAEIKIKIKLIKNNESGITTVNGKKIFNICKNISHGSLINFLLKENFIIIKSFNNIFKLSTLPWINYPKLSLSDYKINFLVKQKLLKYIIEKTQFSMAYNDIRYYLNGMLLKIDNNKMQSITTDGHRLSMCYVNLKESLCKYSVIIPNRSIIELNNLIKNKDEIIKIKIGSNNIYFFIDNIIFISKLINLTHPDYEKILPKEMNQFIEINSNLLKESLIRLSILSNEKFKCVNLHISNNLLKLKTNNLQNEKAEEILNIKYKGENINICLNIDYVLDIINAIKSDSIRILFKDSSSSIKIDNGINNNLCYIVMPIIL